MNSQLNRRSRITALLCGAAAIACAAPARAETAAATDAGTVDEVVVTGTLFKQSVTGSQLVTTVSSEDLAQIGATNASEALRTIAQNQPINISATSIGGGTGFASYANLRTLGSAETLVLFDSKRVVSNPYQAQGVDLNTLPLNLIDRVETLADGASSIYGSDAIAGVINFLPKREFKGLSVEGTYLQPESRGGRNRQFAASGGIGTLAEDGWNLYAGYTWRKKDLFYPSTRDFSNRNFIPEHGVNRLQSTTFPANYSQGPLQDINPSAPGCLPPTSISIGGTGCRFDFQPILASLPQQKDQSFLVQGTAKALGQTFMLQYLRGQDDLKAVAAPSQVNNAQMSPSNPFFPGKGITPGVAGLNPNAPITVNWRTQELGPDVTAAHSRTNRILGQVDGSKHGFDYEAWALYSDSTVRLNTENGEVDVAAVARGLSGANGAPFLNPFGPQTAAGEQYLQANVVRGNLQHAKSKLKMFGGQVTHDLFDLPAGAVKLALAAEYRDESTAFTTTALGPATTEFPTASSIDGSRHAYSVTSEVKVPILENLDLDASLRYDHYSDFGGTANPKVLLSWRPTDWLTLHGSYNKGFRAPTLYNVISPTGLLPSRSRFPDPVLCPGGVVNTAAGGVTARDCGGVPFNDRTGGNPDIGPEKSDAYSLGLKLRPMDSIDISVDYWNYHLRRTIAPLAESAIFGDIAKFGDLIVRCSQAEPAIVAAASACAPGHTGDPIAYVDQRPQNLGDTKTDGVDVSLIWRGPEASWGQLTFDYEGTYVFNFDFQRVPDGPFFSRAGRYFDGFPVIDYSHYASVTWRKDNWTVQLANRYLNGYVDCNAQCNNLPVQFHQSVDHYSIWNVSGTWTVGRATVIARINNLFDTDPPFTNKTQGVGTGWDERFADPIGRSYSLTLKYDFY